MRKRLWKLLPVCLSLCLALPLAGTARAEGETAPRDNGMPYYITVDRVWHVTTVYGLDNEGYYTVPVRSMVCSVGKPGEETPLGTYQITDQYDWCYMVDGSYGQYASRVYRGIMFHSVCFRGINPAGLMTYEYNSLGSSVSLGCIRLQTGDAKWVYDNCGWGTMVTIFDGTEPPDPMPKKLVEYIDLNDPKAGWDPTDPRGENPWHAWLEENALPFDDVPFGSRRFADIQYAVRTGLMGEKAPGKFRPDWPVTFAEARDLIQTLTGEGRRPVLALGDMLWLQRWTSPEEDAAVTGTDFAGLLERYLTLRQGERPRRLPTAGMGEAEMLTRADLANWIRRHGAKL